MSCSQVTDLIIKLIDANYRARSFYTDCIRQSELMALKEFFMAQASQKNRFINSLTDNIIDLNKNPRGIASNVVTTSNAWSELMPFLKDYSDETILTRCMKVEQNLLGAYTEALRCKFILNFARELIESQRDELDELIKNAFIK